MTDKPLSAVLTVTIETRDGGDYYFDHDDLMAQVIPWIEGALDDRDDIARVTIEAQQPAVPVPADDAEQLRKEHATWRKLGQRNLERAHEENARLRAEHVAVEKKLRHSEKRSEELRVESRRRGKVKLEYAEQIRQLEKKLDEVRTQLGAEILRSGQAETELRRASGAVVGVVADMTPAETVHACPPDGSGLTPCCGRTPFELPSSDRISSETDAVTCRPSALAQRCATCGLEIENRGDPDMGGRHEIRWVHVRSGTACRPQDGADSPRATPAQPTGT